MENVSANLNDPQERNTFIGLLKREKEILDLTCCERASNNPAKMMKCQQGNLVLTLEEVLQQLPPLAQLTRSSDSPMQKKELSFRSRLSMQPTLRRSKPIQKAKTVGSILLTDGSFNKDNPHPQDLIILKDCETAASMRLLPVNNLTQVNPALHATSLVMHLMTVQS